VERLIVAAVLVVVAGVVAAVVQRRQQADAPTGPRSYTVPAQLDRRDFDRPEAQWLAVLFSSTTCLSCEGLRDKVMALASDSVSVQDVDSVADKALQDRYGIDAVPTVVIADSDGVVRASFVGSVTATDLWATMADLREPGSVPPGCDHGVG
jgi:thioredoxin-related protein